VCREFEIEVDEKIIPRIAFGFGGGIGNTGEVCGAVAGAVMAIGLKVEKGETMEEMFRVFGVVQEFRRRFEAEMETIICRELTGADLSTEEGIAQFMDSKKIGVRSSLLTFFLSGWPSRFFLNLAGWLKGVSRRLSMNMAEGSDRYNVR